MSRNMNTRFFAEFLVVLSRRVNPCPGVDDGDDSGDCCSTTKPLVEANGTLHKNNSTLSLHSK